MKILIGIVSIATVNIYKTADHTAVAQVIHSWVTAVNTVHGSADRLHGSADRLHGSADRLHGSADRLQTRFTAV